MSDRVPDHAHHLCRRRLRRHAIQISQLFEQRLPRCALFPSSNRPERQKASKLRREQSRHLSVLAHAQNDRLDLPSLRAQELLQSRHVLHRVTHRRHLDDIRAQAHALRVNLRQNLIVRRLIVIMRAQNDLSLPIPQRRRRRFRREESLRRERLAIHVRRPALVRPPKRLQPRALVPIILPSLPSRSIRHDHRHRRRFNQRFDRVAQRPARRVVAQEIHPELHDVRALPRGVVHVPQRELQVRRDDGRGQFARRARAHAHRASRRRRRRARRRALALISPSRRARRRAGRRAGRARGREHSRASNRVAATRRGRAREARSRCDAR